MRFGKVRHLHFIGIGGAGMSGIARILLDSGYVVSGSDLRDSEPVQRLRQAGARIAIGHDPSNLGQDGGPDVVVRSTAVRDDNPEVRAALDLHVPVIHRAEMLAELMRLKHGIAVAGAHGKTTTTSLIAHILDRAGLDPTVIIGGRVKNLEDNGKLGRGDLLVAEADESDGSFLQLNPVLSVINNLDKEHLEHWGSYEALREGFVEFANRVPFWGAVMLGQDDPELTELRPRIRRPVRTFGIDRPADFEARVLEVGATGSRIRVRALGEEWGEVVLPLAGRHNVRNALAAAAIAHELDIEPATVLEALAGFPGIERRFEVLHDGEILVIDDYGHHPAELEATLAAARERYDRPIWAVFQPHRYTRTAQLWDDFRTALLMPDHVRITDIHPAGEDPIEGVTAAGLARAVHDGGHPDVAHLPLAELQAGLRAEVPAGAVVLFLGAGSITKEAHVYAEALA